jgi:hypothetical protein
MAMGWALEMAQGLALALEPERGTAQALEKDWAQGLGLVLATGLEPPRAQDLVLALAVG